jgi:hypothetical protein
MDTYTYVTLCYSGGHVSVSLLHGNGIAESSLTCLYRSCVECYNWMRSSHLFHFLLDRELFQHLFTDWYHDTCFDHHCKDWYPPGQALDESIN